MARLFFACAEACHKPALRTADAGAPDRDCEPLHFPMRLSHECYKPAGAQLPPNVTWAPAAELPPFQEQLLRAANTPRDLCHGAFALGLTRSVRKSLLKQGLPSSPDILFEQHSTAASSTFCIEVPADLNQASNNPSNNMQCRLEFKSLTALHDNGVLVTRHMRACPLRFILTQK